MNARGLLERMDETARTDHLTSEAHVPTGLRIVVFGNGGYASGLLAHLLARGERVVGLITRTTTSPTGFVVVRGAIARLAQRCGIAPDAYTYADSFVDVVAPQHIAHQHGIPVLDASTIRSPAFCDAFRTLAPDLAFVAGFHRLIPVDLLGIPVRAFVNFHPSLLPARRGGTPNRWVIRYGDAETGVTAHLVTERFDAGDILAQQRIAVRPDDTCGSLEHRIADALTTVVCEVLDRAAAGPLVGFPQDAARATYDPPYHGAHQAIDWTLSADEVRRTCDAIRPKSGGLASFRGRTLCLWACEVFPTTSPSAPPGTVVACDRGGMIIACGSGAVRVVSVLERGRIVPMRALVSRYAITAGSRFDTEPATLVMRTTV